MMFACVFAAGAQAEAFKNSEFLKYSKSSQEGYITTAAGMAGVIATQNNKAQATCIDSWIAEHRKTGYQSVIDTMRNYPDYHPMGIIAGILQKKCGSFKYQK